MEPNVADIRILVNQYSGNIQNIKEYYNIPVAIMLYNTVTTFKIYSYCDQTPLPCLPITRDPYDSKDADTKTSS